MLSLNRIAEGTRQNEHKFPKKGTLSRVYQNSVSVSIFLSQIWVLSQQGINLAFNSEHLLCRGFDLIRRGPGSL